MRTRGSSTSRLPRPKTKAFVDELRREFRASYGPEDRRRAARALEEFFRTQQRYVLSLLDRGKIEKAKRLQGELDEVEPIVFETLRQAGLTP